MGKGHKYTRREALRLGALTAATAGLAAASESAEIHAAQPQRRQPAAHGGESHGSEAHSGAVLEELSCATIKPEGWLRQQLAMQRDGLTGHLREICPPFTGDAWSKDETRSDTSWVAWENLAYWCDGAVRCGIALDDAALIAQARRLIDFTLAHPGKHGYLGPSFLEAPGDFHRWPHAVFFRAVLAWQQATGDPAPLEKLTQHYLGSEYAHTGFREEVNIEPMLLLYARTGNPRLLEKAVATWHAFQKQSFEEPDFQFLLERALLSPDPAPCHGVTYAEHTKLPALLYMHTGEARYRELAVQAQRKVFSHHMLVDGTPSSTERLSSTDSRDGHETCDTTDFAWNWGYLLMATGEGEYGDRIERAVLNAGMGAVRRDWKALQYYSGPNQFLCTEHSDHLAILKGVTPQDIREYRYMQRMSYRPSPGYTVPCCPGNVNRFLPNYLGRMWMRHAGDHGLAATLYGPCRVKARVGSAQQEVEIVEETNYPFAEEIAFSIASAHPVEFALHLRIPAWCEQPEIRVNGRSIAATADARAFVTVRRRFAHGDRVTLKLPMPVKTSNWPENGIAVERGPLVYAYAIAQTWTRVEDTLSTDAFPAWDLSPDGDWNFALVRGEGALQAEVVEGEARSEERAKRAAAAGGAQDDPWAHPPVRLRVPARRVRDWQLMQIKDAQRDWTFTPPLPDPVRLPDQLDAATETITLVPYGSTQLRLTVFPMAREQPKG